MPTTSRHACERCRRVKVRCLVETVAIHGSCRRCHESNAECVFGDIAPRQRRKRTDTRLALLEQQVKALQETYSAAHPHAGVCADQHTNFDEGRPSVDFTTGSNSPPTLFTVQPDSIGEEFSPAVVPNSDTIPGYVNDVDVSYELGVGLFTKFTEDLLPQYPILTFSDNDTFDNLRVSKPLLLFASVTAASSTQGTDLFERLHSRLLCILSNKVVLDGEKSLELVQAILIAEVWYSPPSDLKKLNFYLWIQLAATLTVELGLTWERLGKAMETADPMNLEALQVALAVYLSVSTFVPAPARFFYADCRQCFSELTRSIHGPIH